MDRTRFFLLIPVLVFSHMIFHAHASPVDSQNAEADFQLSDLSPKSPGSRNFEMANGASTNGDDGSAAFSFASPTGRKMWKRNYRIRGGGRSSVPAISDSGENFFSEKDPGSKKRIAAGLGVRAQAATTSAQQAFQSYLERSDYYHAHQSRRLPPAKLMTSQGDDEAAQSSLGRRKLTSVPESAPDMPLGSWNLDQTPRALKEPVMYLIVSQQGNGDFTTVQQAVDFVREGNSHRVVIRIYAGVYREKVVVPRSKPFITFHGEDQTKTIITWNATAASRVAVGEGFWNASDDFSLFGTMQSASVSVLSDNFIAHNISFQNSAPAPNPGAENSQAVAFLIAGDSAAFYNCTFLGAQDTLYDYKGRHYYYKCFIQGSIDFIFGNGRTLFQNCTLSSIATRFGAIAAQQKRMPDEDTGFVFVGCYVNGTGSVYLGRAWSPYATIVFANSYFEDVIDAEGWSDFGDPKRRSTTFFGLYECSGPGSNPPHLVPWSKNLTVDEVKPYLGQNYVNGQQWLVDPGVDAAFPPGIAAP
ncbi:hypothetical protein Mapa_013528 [Marchantia paleacea]|nr:hypothetical protein Mapa_013528 [Marchantia paleacea]